MLLLTVYVVAVCIQTSNVDCSIQNRSNPVQMFVNYDLNLKTCRHFFPFSSIISFYSITILWSKINFHWWAQEILRKSNIHDSFYTIFSFFFFCDQIKGVRREGLASCMAELRDVNETLFGKPARQGHPSEL
jgi:hypothetical protein